MDFFSQNVCFTAKCEDFSNFISLITFIVEQKNDNYSSDNQKAISIPLFIVK